MAYHVYLGDTELPVPPEKIDLKISGNNKTLTLINDGEINLLKVPGLSEISFEMLLPQVQYPFAYYPNGFQKAQYYLDVLEKYMVGRKPFQLIVSRTLPNGIPLHDTNMKVSLEEYSVTEDVQNGFIFTQKRDKAGTIDITAYDQLRYLKNKDSYIYENKTAGQLVQMIATDFHLQCGEIANTEYVIASRVEDNCTLFDTIQNALDLTLIHEKKLYILYDDFGKLTLKNIEDMRLDVLVDNETAENYSYTSTIDSNTYNKVKIAYDNNETGEREVYVVQDAGNINEWGVLQYREKMQKGENPQEKANAYLSLYNKKTRNLTIDSVLGDKRVRAGSSIAVLLDLGDMTVQNYMVVQHVKHTFTNHQHLMDLTLMGGDFSV